MAFYASEAKVSKDPIVGLMKLAAADESSDKLVAVAGAAKTDDGKLFIPDAINKVTKEIAEKGVDMSYAPSTGIPNLAEHLSLEIIGKDTIINLKTNNIFLSGVVCNGGTGAISTSILTCTTKDDPIICHNPHWVGFDSIMLGLNRAPLINFELLDEEGNFNAKAFEQVLDETAKKFPNSKLTALINTPFDNPLGKDFGEDGWNKIGEVLSKFSDKEIVLLLDTAYVDFGPGGKDYRRLAFLPDLFKKVNNANFHVVVAGSMSKSFGMYGGRIGTAVLISTDTDLVSSWADRAGGVLRGTISNCARITQEIAMGIFKDMKKLADVHDYQEKLTELIAKRNYHFITSLINGSGYKSDKASYLEENLIKLNEDLTIIRPDGGFFTSIKLSSKELGEKLAKKFLDDKTYIPIVCDEYLRIPTCSLKEDTLEQLADRILKTAAKA
jgi:aromatic-amino-acid transaminase